MSLRAAPGLPILTRRVRLAGREDAQVHFLGRGKRTRRRCGLGPEHCAASWAQFRTIGLEARDNSIDARNCRTAQAKHVRRAGLTLRLCSLGEAGSRRCCQREGDDDRPRRRKVSACRNYGVGIFVFHAGPSFYLIKNGNTSKAIASTSILIAKQSAPVCDPGHTGCAAHPP